MILSTDGTYPALAIVASRPKYTAAPPIEPIGVLIVKQTLQPGGHLGGEAQLLLEDVLYESPPCKPGDLEIHLESDLAPYKPMLDLVVVRDSCKRGGFGHVWIANPGTTPSKWMKLDYGWRSRVRDPRQKAAGDANEFRPPAVTDGEMLPLTELLKLPKNYQSSYNNGGRIPDLPLLGPGDQVWFRRTAPLHLSHSEFGIVIPPQPGVKITLETDEIIDAAALTIAVDTVVYDEPAGHILLTWRGILPWEERFAGAEVQVFWANGVDT